jgi:hypothetical protein
MSATQRPPCKACATVRTRTALLSTVATRSGAKELMERPSSQLSRHNQVPEPLPTATVVEASNIACSYLSPTAGSVVYVRLGSTRTSQAQHRRRACPSIVKSSTPNPPSSIGRVTLGHATLQCPPEVLDVPHQINARRILSMSQRYQGIPSQQWKYGTVWPTTWT